MTNNREVITFLPESLIIFIISFLPLIDAVRFCSLSREWFKLWVYCKHLEFDEMLFIEAERVYELWRNGKHDEASRLKLNGRRRFIDYVDYTLPRFVEQQIFTFKLRFAYEAEYKDHVEAWIRYVISRDVKELILDFSDGAPLQVFHAIDQPYFDVPEFLFAATHLKVLSLSFCDFKSFNFQRFIGITSLYLRGISLEEDLVQNLVTNCSLLEDLSIVNSSMQGELVLASPKLNLKKLIIKGSVLLGPGILLSAPNLQYFEYSGILVTINIEKLGDLAEVMLDIRVHRLSFSVGKFHRLLTALDKARSLKLNDHFIKVVLLDDLSWNNLFFPLVNPIHLTLKTAVEENELPGILTLLRSTPNLETLTFQLGSSFDESRVHHEPTLTDLQFDAFALFVRTKWEPPKAPFRNLKTIKFEGFMGFINEMKLLVFLLQNATVLQQVIISPATTELLNMGSWAVQQEVRKKVGTISESVEIVFQTVS